MRLADNIIVAENDVAGIAFAIRNIHCYNCRSIIDYFHRDKAVVQSVFPYFGLAGYRQHDVGIDGFGNRDVRLHSGNLTFWEKQFKLTGD